MVVHIGRRVVEVACQEPLHKRFIKELIGAGGREDL